MRHRTQIVASHFNTPSSTDRRLFHAVLRAGHLKAAPDYRIERLSYPGHDLLLCIAGSGYVRSAGRDFAVRVGQLAWIDCRSAHAHWPDPNHPWEVLWMRVEGLQTLAQALKVRRTPVFSLPDRHQTPQLFRQACILLREKPVSMNAALHAIVMSVVAILFEARQGEVSEGHGRPSSDPDLRKVLELMRNQYARPWNIENLARLTGLSVPHFFRRFRKATGCSPIEWLRHERVNQAKRQLVESARRIQEIAVDVGYKDPFYFSRDFKRIVGVSPRRYRHEEGTRHVE